MKLLIALLISLPLAANAQQCVLQDKTVTQGSAVIAERTEVRAEVVSGISGGKKCMVNFRVRIGTEWHTTFGEYDWAGDRPRAEACAVAVKRAEDAVQQRVSATKIMSEKVLICRDDPDLNTLRSTNPGTVGNLAQFRPHSELTKEFWHNGAPCRFFLESAYVGTDIRTFQGVICKIQNNKWVVVDKF